MHFSQTLSLTQKNAKTSLLAPQGGKAAAIRDTADAAVLLTKKSGSRCGRDYTKTSTFCGCAYMNYYYLKCLLSFYNIIL
jgi:uncharacterized membrane protein YebE (DUF533 family)